MVKFIGVYRGINSAKQIFLLMSRRHAEQFNSIATKWANSTDVLESFNTTVFTEDESYNSQISSEESSNEYEDDIGDTHKQIFEPIYENRPSLCSKIDQKREEVHSKLAVTRCHVNSAQQVHSSLHSKTFTQLFREETAVQQIISNIYTILICISFQILN